MLTQLPCTAYILCTFLINHKQILILVCGIRDYMIVQGFEQTQTCLRIKKILFCINIHFSGKKESVHLLTRWHVCIYWHLESILFGSLEFKTSFSQYFITVHTQLPANKAQCSSLTCTRFANFEMCITTNEILKTTVFQLVSAELRITLMCSILFKKWHVWIQML